MHAHLAQESARCCHLTVGDELFRGVGMVFGLTVSPQKFQMLNRVLVSALLRRHHHVLLYLDDRLAFSKVTRALAPGETTITTYSMLVGLVAFGVSLLCISTSSALFRASFPSTKVCFYQPLTSSFSATYSTV